MKPNRKGHAGKTLAERQEYLNSLEGPGPTVADSSQAVGTNQPAGIDAALVTRPLPSRSNRHWFSNRPIEIQAVWLTLAGTAVLTVLGYLWVTIFGMNREVGEIHSAQTATDETVKEIPAIKDRLLRLEVTAEQKSSQRRSQP